MDEINNIIERYKNRSENKIVNKNDKNFYYNYYSSCERELKYIEILQKKFPDFKNLKFIEIGAGGGNNLYCFLKSGFRKNNVYGNELIQERFNSLQEKFGDSNLIQGDACNIKYENYSDVVFQSTVFTSILDSPFKKKLADKLLYSLTKQNGIILWYDFIYNSPKNPDVKGIKKDEIRLLFPQAKKIKFHKVTFAPPIGRKIGKLYTIFNFFLPFLRTHLIVEIHK